MHNLEFRLEMIPALVLAQVLQLPSTNTRVPVQICHDEQTPYGSGYPLSDPVAVKHDLNEVVSVKTIKLRGAMKILAYIVALKNGNQYLQPEPSPQLSEVERRALYATASTPGFLPKNAISEFKIGLNSNAKILYRIYPTRNAFSSHGLVVASCTPRK
ncbi:MAG: hypothetical protein ACYDA1_05280 [Vulcanimicrobiaceae bacterium]